MTSLRLSVEFPSNGERLDRFLARAQTDLSRNRLQALIRAGLVRVNGTACKAGQRLHDGDRVEVELPPSLLQAFGEAAVVPWAGRRVP